MTIVPGQTVVLYWNHAPTPGAEAVVKRVFRRTVVVEIYGGARDGEWLRLPRSVFKEMS